MRNTPNYLSEIFSKPNLSKDREQELAFKINEESCLKSKNELFESNLRLVLSITKKYSFKTEYEDDIFNEGCVGLWEAVESFKPIGFRFSSFASHKINFKILSFLAKNAKTVYIPVASFRILRKIKNYINEYVETHGHEPSCKQISEDLDIKLEKIELLCNSCDSKLSFDKKFNEDEEGSLYDTFTEEASSNKSNLDELQKHIQQAMESLTEKEKLVISKRYGINNDNSAKFKEIGKTLGLTKQRAEQINRLALDKLKKSFVITGINSPEYV